MSVINSILLQFFLVFLVGGAIVGILFGAGMLLKHEQVLRLNQYFSRWIGAGKIEEQLDRPRWTERFFYRHHRPVGAGLFVGAMVVLYTFLISYNSRTISAVIAPGNRWLLDALLWLLLIGSVVAAIVGFIVLLRPSLLRELEKSTNRWIATKRAAELFNDMHYAFDQSVIRHRKLTGTLLVIGSVYVLIGLGYFLFRGGWKLL